MSGYGKSGLPHTRRRPPVQASSHGSPPRSSDESHAVDSIQSNAPSESSLQLPPHAASQVTSSSSVTAQETSASAINPAPQLLEPIKPRDWSFVEEEQARKQASGAIKRRKDPLQKSDISAGGRLPSIDHSALYAPTTFPQYVFVTLHPATAVAICA